MQADRKTFGILVTHEEFASARTSMQQGESQAGSLCHEKPRLLRFIELASDGRVVDGPRAGFVDVVFDQLPEAVNFCVEIIQ